METRVLLEDILLFIDILPTTTEDEYIAERIKSELTLLSDECARFLPSDLQKPIVKKD